MGQYADIGERLRRFAERRYGSVPGLAKALGKAAPQALYAYVRGDSRPGPTLQEELREAGCDVEWLMTGARKAQRGSTESEKAAFAWRFAEFGHARFGEDFEWKDRYAEALGVTPATLKLYLAGEEKPPLSVQKKLRNLGCDVEWLLSGRIRESADRNEPLFGGELGVIPVYGFVDADPEAGEQFETLENVHYPFFRGKYFALIIRGDSMIQAKLPSGREGLYPDDLVIFEQGRTPKNGDVVAVELRGGKRVVKIFERKKDHAVILNSANRFRNYPGFQIREDDVVSWGIYVNHFPLDEAFKRRMGIPVQRKR
jgi:SOS-response transcriptional repressor LexA